MAAPRQSVEVGLARERTSLAWTRTALALFVNGILVLLRNEHSFPLPLALTLSVLWVLLALLAVWYAARRHRVLAATETEVLAAAPVNAVLAVGVAALCLATALGIALT